MAYSPISSWQIDGETMRDFIFGGSKITVDGDCSHEIKRHLLLGRKAMANLDSVLKIRDVTLLTKVRLVRAMVFPSSHVWVWELECKESWVPKNWCFWTVVLEKTLESPLESKEIQPVNPKGNQSWIFIGRTDAEAETSILWQPDVKNRLIEKDPDARKDWRQEEKVMTEDEMVGWHHQLNGHEFEQAPAGVGDGQGSLVCCSPWGRKELDMTERLNWSVSHGISLNPGWQASRDSIPRPHYLSYLKCCLTSCAFGRYRTRAVLTQVRSKVRGLLSCFWTLNKTSSILISLTGSPPH